MGYVRWVRCFFNLLYTLGMSPVYHRAAFRQTTALEKTQPTHDAKGESRETSVF